MPLRRPGDQSARRVRRPSGGRKRLIEKNPELRSALDRLIEPTTRGDPENPRRWTCKSAANLTAVLRQQGFAISERTVNRLLHDLGYRRQANKKTRDGRQNPDRDAQFQFIEPLAKFIGRAIFS
ncbi:MAG: hypothetical protein OXE94_08415 [Aestuariivita sp.]|nr:hypothetical protein [Aestuariivita sp.]